MTTAFAKAEVDDTTAGQRAYGCIYWRIPKDSELYALQQMIGQQIPDGMLAHWGREMEPHITFRYGILDTDYSQLIPYLQALQPFDVTLGELITFPPSEHSDGSAPLIFRIQSTALEVIHQELAGYANFKPSDFDSFQPHISVAYLNALYAEEVVAEFAPLVRMLFLGKQVLVQDCIISPAQGTGEKICIVFGSEQVETIHKLAKAGKKKTIVGDPTKRTKIKDAAEAQIENAVQEALNATISDILDSIEDQIAAQESADSIAASMSQASFDTNIPEIVADALAPVMAEAAADQFAELGITDDGLFDTINNDALKYAKDRGAELVGRKWVNGVLRDNPDATYAITETTRDGLKSLVQQSYTDGWTPRELAKEIQESYNFSAARAKMIASTETNRASSEGIIQSWRRSDMVRGKSWNLSADHGDQDDECDDNEDDGVIDIDETFSSGDDAPPAHPNCYCSLSGHLDTEIETEGIDDADEE